MYKNSVISLLAAVLISDMPWFEIKCNAEKVGLIVGIAAAVFIFLLFLECACEKVRNYIERVDELKRTIEKLRKGVRT